MIRWYDGVIKQSVHTGINIIYVPCNKCRSGFLEKGINQSFRNVYSTKKTLYMYLCIKESQKIIDTENSDD